MEWGASADGQPVPGDEPSGDGWRILVCDDTTQIRQLIRLNLELEGYQVVEAVDGQDALEILKDTTRTLPDVVTLDALMPRRDGWWAVSMIRADPRLAAIPIIMVTASAQSQDRVQAVQAEVDGFMAKPFDPDELISMIGTLARRGRGHGSKRAQPRP